MNTAALRREALLFPTTNMLMVRFCMRASMVAVKQTGFDSLADWKLPQHAMWQSRHSSNREYSIAAGK